MSSTTRTVYCTIWQGQYLLKHDVSDSYSWNSCSLSMLTKFCLFFLFAGNLSLFIMTKPAHCKGYSCFSLHFSSSLVHHVLYAVNHPTWQWLLHTFLWHTRYTDCKCHCMWLHMSIRCDERVPPSSNIIMNLIINPPGRSSVEAVEKNQSKLVGECIIYTWR